MGCRARRIGLLLVLSLLTIHAVTPVVHARDKTPATSNSVEEEKINGRQKESSDTDAFGAWGRLLAAMALVVAMIVALGWLVKRIGAGKGLQSAGALRLVARANLSPKHQVFLVRLGRRLVLLGAGPQGLSGLSEVTDAEEISELLQAAGMKRLPKEGGDA